MNRKTREIIRFALAFLALSSTSALPTRNGRPTCLTVDCAIIGGGPAGLAAAIAVAKASPASTIAVFERDSFRPKGATIQISKPGWRSLRELDALGKGDGAGSLVQKLKGTGVPVTSLEIKPWNDDPDKNGGDQKQTSKRARLQKRIPSLLLETVVPFFFRLFLRRPLTYTHLWHDVRTTLAEQAQAVYAGNRQHRTAATEGDPDLPLLNLNLSLGKIRFLAPDNERGCRFELSFQDATTEAQAPTRIVHARYVVACDGTQSRTRALLPDEPYILLAENKSVWRGVAPNIDSQGKATMYQSDGADPATAGRSALIFPGGKGAGSSWTIISDVDDASARKSATDAEARRRVLTVVASMGSSGGGDAELFRRAIADSPLVIENKLHVRDFDQPWASAYDGLVYAGDAAHPVRPTGEGLALAFEDARVLGRTLLEPGGAAGSCRLSVAALRAYEDERYEPVKEISERVRATAEAFYRKEGDVLLQRGFEDSS